MNKYLNKAMLRRRQEPRAATEALARIESITRMARANWLALLSFLAFVGVTLMGVEDADFFLTERQTQLPLIGVMIPTNLFFYIAPALGALLYVHLHIYLLKLWKALADAPTSFVGNPLSERASVWVVVDMALAHRPGASHAYSLRGLAGFVTFVSIFLFGPIILLTFWWRSMPKHDEVLTVIACGVPLIASLYAGTKSYMDLRRAMRQVPPSGENSGYFGKTALIFLFVLACLVAIGGGWLMTEGVLAGCTDYFNSRKTNCLKNLDPRQFARAKLEFVRFAILPVGWVDANVAEPTFRAEWCNRNGIDLLACGAGPLASTSPSPISEFQRRSWCAARSVTPVGQDACAEAFDSLELAYPEAWRSARLATLNSLSSVDLQEADLRGAYLAGANLTRTNLRSARLDRADMTGAILEGTIFSAAQLELAGLSRANMRFAILVGANLSGALLVDALLSGANFTAARLVKSDLSGVRVDESTSFSNAELDGAALWNTDYSTSSISQAQINSAFGDATVILPPHLFRPAHWPVREWTRLDFLTEWSRWRDDPTTYTPPPPPTP
ncbi:pentapeptide repeat-containing protein [Phaeovulum sp.]|uniref:pentapeptide repeat-containing protein n=2 Tax=Phaeovulum sp. TaxID=2934796 RepID=UPI002730B184|nr:pentapeptide repeat-containing protein [Phaeovulum sp.]MDP1668509.1 pentapeptide repeat-containing protein [Phaeovulum sp.]MDZ4118792.1 pentapeptide repeat-containing protein [Phaeovulum sp.]